MKILSISDVITNSSSEVFIIDKKDSKFIPKELKEYCTEVTKENFINLVANGDYNMFDARTVTVIPKLFDIFNDSNDLEDLRKIHSDLEIVEFYAPLLKELLDKVVISLSDEDSFGYQSIQKLQDALDSNNVKYMQERC